MRDQFLFKLGNEVQRTQAELSNALATGFNVEAARARHESKQRAFDAYRAEAATLSEPERQYAIEHDMPATALVSARSSLAEADYQAAIVANTALPEPTSIEVVLGRDVGLVQPLTLKPRKRA